MYLIEVDRVLRPGGYWILSGPPIHWKKYWRGWERTKEDLKQEQDAIEDVAKRLCWKKVIEKNDLAIWQKPINHIECNKSREVYKTPEICKPSNPDTAWYFLSISILFCHHQQKPLVVNCFYLLRFYILNRYKDMETCITPLPGVSSSDEVAGGALEKWPERAFALPPRITSGSLSGVTQEQFHEDNEQWKDKVTNYKRVIGLLPKGRYRNIMDMNANLGGFAAAMSKYPVWVMNVVPVHSNQDTLGVIYERGFIGTYHDWCEAFSTYPRTYDLIHADNVFSLYQNR